MVTAVKDLAWRPAARHATDAQAAGCNDAAYNHNVGQFLAGVLRQHHSRAPYCACSRRLTAAAASSAWVSRSMTAFGMLVLLANMPEHPGSVPINMWNEVKVPVMVTAERPDPIALSDCRRIAS